MKDLLALSLLSVVFSFAFGFVIGSAIERQYWIKEASRRGFAWSRRNKDGSTEFKWKEETK